MNLKSRAICFYIASSMKNLTIASHGPTSMLSLCNLNILTTVKTDSLFKQTASSLSYLFLYQGELE